MGLRSYMQQLSGADADVAVTTLASRIEALIDVGASTQWTFAIDPTIRLVAALDRQVFLLAKELISNVQRHAQATAAGVCLTRDEAARLLLEVTDDGVGFAPNEVTAGSFGLRSVRLRAGNIGAELAIDSDGGGTRVRVIIPAGTASLASPPNA